MMSILQAVVLGVVQGLTEFLPISSSAHLILIPHFLGWGDFPLVFDTSLHLGTALAVVVYFFNDLLTIKKRTAWFIFIGSLPVVAAGLLFGDFLEANGLALSSFGLLFGSLAMFFAERHFSGGERPDNVGFKSSFFIGLAQALSLIPGVSRSGITISAGLIQKFDREYAARFSFLLSIPAVFAAASYKLLTTFSEIESVGYSPWLVGMLVSFVSGILTISFLLNFLKTRSLNVFIFYRVVFLVIVLFSL